MKMPFGTPKHEKRNCHIVLNATAPFFFLIISIRLFALLIRAGTRGYARASHIKPGSVFDQSLQRFEQNVRIDRF